ncbi:Hsp20/alpha crystallin family protein [Nitratidesulfovibrio termitidis]|uniref:Hsp20/alpha crystallin family protein n=1 Tax=Nitratidesulfovibrio termitidis TaxID=42252 RepID=UPI000425E576|nr:Hsp20/alpha crystallin family protein [Nitratidesulfovibrio termitidis]
MVIDFSTLYDMPKSFERMFDEMSRLHSFSSRRTAYPLLNVHENDDGYTVDVSVPGVAPGDVELTLTDRNLIIKGERKATEGRYFRQERLSGSFQRILSLNVPVDRDRVSARSENGILRVTLPKAEAVKPRKIAVEASAGGVQ